MGWMVDLEIQHTLNATPLGLMLGPAGDFRRRVFTRCSIFDPQRESRVIEGGFLSCAVVPTERSVWVRIPSDREVVWSCLDVRFANTVRHRTQAVPVFEDLHVSDKGQYLQGMLKLFGSIATAGHFLEDPFWRDIFLLMAGRPEKDFARRRERARKVIDNLMAEKPNPNRCCKSPP